MGWSPSGLGYLLTTPPCCPIDRWNTDHSCSKPYVTYEVSRDNLLRLRSVEDFGIETNWRRDRIGQSKGGSVLRGLSLTIELYSEYVFNDKSRDGKLLGLILSTMVITSDLFIIPFPTPQGPSNNVTFNILKVDVIYPYTMLRLSTIIGHILSSIILPLRPINNDSWLLNYFFLLLFNPVNLWLNVISYF